MTRKNPKEKILLPLHDMLQKDEKIFLMKELYFSYTIFIIIIISII